MRTTLSAAACAAAGALLLSPLAAGIATAQNAPNTVGMTQEQATTTLTDSNVPGASSVAPAAPSRSAR